MGEKGNETDVVPEETPRKRDPKDCLIWVSCRQLQVTSTDEVADSHWDCDVSLDGGVREIGRMLVPSRNYVADPGLYWTIDRNGRCGTQIPLSFVITVRSHPSQQIGVIEGSVQAVRTYLCPSETDQEVFEVRAEYGQIWANFRFVFRVKLICGDPT